MPGPYAGVPGVTNHLKGIAPWVELKKVASCAESPRLNASMNVVNTERAHAVLSAADRATGTGNAGGVGKVAKVGSSVDVQPA